MPATKSTRRTVLTAPGRAANPIYDNLYLKAFRLAESGKRDEARELYLQLDADGVDLALRAEAINSLAVLDGLEERHYASRNGFKRALSIDPTCKNAQHNLAMLESCGCGEHEEMSMTWRRHEEPGGPFGHAPTIER